MRIPYSVKLVLLAACLVVVTPTVALAHVTVSPEGVAPGDFATLTVKVPTEKEIPTTEVRVEVPEGFTLGGVQPVPGWEHRFEELATHPRAADVIAAARARAAAAGRTLEVTEIVSARDADRR